MDPGRPLLPILRGISAINENSHPNRAVKSTTVCLSFPPFVPFWLSSDPWVVPTRTTLTAFEDMETPAFNSDEQYTY